MPFLMLTAALALAAPPAAVPPMIAPTTAPSAQAPYPLVNDKTYTDLVIKPHVGKVLLVNFWASYCLPCLEEIPALQAIQKEMAADVDVVFVATDAPDSGAHAQKVLTRRKIALDSFIVENEDPDPFIRFIDDVWQGEMPYSIVYRADGTVHQKLPGAHAGPEFKAALTAARAASPQMPAKASNATKATKATNTGTTSP